MFRFESKNWSKNHRNLGSKIHENLNITFANLRWTCYIFDAKKPSTWGQKSLKIRSGQVSWVHVMSRWTGDLPQLDFQAGGGLNVIVGCVPPLNGRSSHLIEAAKRGRLDQMIFFSAPLTTRAPPGRPAGRPAERPAWYGSHQFEQTYVWFERFTYLYAYRK